MRSNVPLSVIYTQLVVATYTDKFIKLSSHKTVKLLKKTPKQQSIAKLLSSVRQQPEVYDTSDNQNKLGLRGVPEIISGVLQREIPRM